MGTMEAISAGHAVPALPLALVAGADIKPRSDDIPFADGPRMRVERRPHGEINDGRTSVWNPLTTSSP